MLGRGKVFPANQLAEENTVLAMFMWARRKFRPAENVGDEYVSFAKADLDAPVGPARAFVQIAADDQLSRHINRVEQRIMFSGRGREGQILVSAQD